MHDTAQAAQLVTSAAQATEHTCVRMPPLAASSMPQEEVPLRLSTWPPDACSRECEVLLFLSSKVCHPCSSSCPLASSTLCGAFTIARRALTTASTCSYSNQAMGLLFSERASGSEINMVMLTIWNMQQNNRRVGQSHRASQFCLLGNGLELNATCRLEVVSGCAVCT